MRNLYRKQTELRNIVRRNMPSIVLYDFCYSTQSKIIIKAGNWSDKFKPFQTPGYFQGGSSSGLVICR
jgi:hypothetical protein